MAYGDLFKTVTGGIVMETAKNKFVVIKRAPRHYEEGDVVANRDPNWIPVEEE